MVVHPLESSGTHGRSVRGALPSIAVHAAIVLVAVHATAHAAITHDRPTPSPTIHMVPTPPPAPKTEHRTTPVTKSGGAPIIEPLDTKSVTASTTVLGDIPVIDPAQRAATVGTSEFGHGVVPASPFGSGNETHGSAPWAAADVERPVSPVGAAPMPVYPEALRSTGTRGSVTAEFVVDTTGRVELGSFHALDSDNDLFTESVRAAVLRTRFHPAEAGGRRVRQLVQESFSFVLQ